MKTSSQLPRNQNGSTSILYLWTVLAVAGSFLASVVAKDFLQTKSIHQNLCRHQALKFQSSVARSGQKLMSFNKRIRKLRSKRAKVMAQLTLNPIPSVKAKLLLQLKKINLQLGKIAIKQAKVLGQFKHNWQLRRLRLTSKIQKTCNLKKVRCHLGETGPPNLPVQSTDFSPPRVYHWKSSPIQSPMFIWKYWYKAFSLYRNQSKVHGVKIQCQSHISVEGPNQWSVYLSPVREP